MERLNFFSQWVGAAVWRTLLLLVVGTAPALADQVGAGQPSAHQHESNLDPVSKIKSMFGSDTETEVDRADSAASGQETYNGPKARIIIARVRDKTNKGWYSNRLGRAMTDQLSTAMYNSGRFQVMEREAFDAIIEEQRLGHTGLAEGGTTPRMGRIQGADLGVIAAVTAAEGLGGGAGGVGAGGGGILAGVLSSVDRSYIAMEIRIVDLENSRVIAATTVEGTSTDVNVAGIAGTIVGGAALGGALASWNNTPQGKALRVVIAKAVDAVAQKTPKRFFRYGGGGGGSPSRPVNKKVQGLQTKLNELGFDAGPADGIMGPKTRSAISTFQESQGIEQTGSINLETINALQSASRKVAEANDKVKGVQKLLSTLGYYDGDVNGVLNQATQDAVAEFQNQNGLEPTGKLNVDTLTALKEVSEALQSFTSQSD